MTCLILTRNRRHWLPFALRCAQHQTYRPLEILVISDGQKVEDLIPPVVLHAHLEGNRTIGQKRNAGVALASGEVIAHFDDDDYSAPGRLTDQIERMRSTGTAVTGYCPMRFTDGVRWWQYHNSNPRYAVGTSLCYRRDWWVAHPFSGQQVGEDTAFVHEARGSISVADAGEMMFATCHEGNTSPRSYTNNWQAL